MKKEEILQLVTRQMEGNIQELNNSLENYQAASDIDEGDTIDLEELSQQSETKEIQRQLQTQRDIAQAGLELLTDFAGAASTSARSGALLETDKNWFLLGISIPAVQVGDKELLGVSPESPAYSVIIGKTKGEKFKLGNNSYTILGIH